MKAQWQNEDIRTSLKSYSDFCQNLGLDKAQRYLARHRAHEIQDWGTHELDAEGLDLQNELDARLKVMLPFSSEEGDRTKPLANSV